MSTAEKNGAGHSHGRPRAVYDTNILVSAFVYGGNARTCLELAIEEKVILVTSPALLREFGGVLARKFGWPPAAIEGTVRAIMRHAIIVEPAERIRVVKTDPTDNCVIEAAVAGGAQFIVSGDKHHLLLLKKFRGIVICSPAEFLKLLE